MMTHSVPHLLVYISGHGFGHIAQTAPVLNRARALLPGLRLTVISAAPFKQLQSRISGKFEHIPDAVDFGMKMASALDVLPQESLEAYREFHRNFPGRIQAEAARIGQLRPDFVLSNVAYLPLASAKLANVPCAAMCSLNWSDIFSHYCRGMPGADEVLAEMRSAYAAADRFLRLTPGMDMPDLHNVQDIAPIARVGRNCRDDINRQLKLGPEDTLVLVSMGGIDTASPLANWPKLEGVHWLVPGEWGVDRPDVSALSAFGALEIDFTDVLHSCDAMVCKPGYGSFTEAACNGVPVLYVSRHDWPEEPCLVSWLERNGRCREISRQDFDAGHLEPALKALLSLPRPSAVVPEGTNQAADYLLRSMSIASP